MKKLKIELLAISYCFMFILLTSCQHHGVEYRKGNIIAGGGLCKVDGEYSFGGISINTKPYYQEETIPINPLKNQFAIKLADNSTLLSKDFNYFTISVLPEVETGKDDFYNYTYFFIPGYLFRFRNKKLISFCTKTSAAGKRYTPMIGKTDCKKFYTFPISRKNLESIFEKPNEYVFLSGW